MKNGVFNKKVVLGIFALMLLGTFSLQRENNGNVVGDSIRKNFHVQYEQSEEGVIIVDSEQEFSDDEKVFEFKSSKNITRIFCESGDNLLRYDADGNTVKCTFGNFRQFSSSLLSFYSNDGLVDKKAIYFAKDDSGIMHSSTMSLDTAKKYAGQELGYGFGCIESESDISALKTGRSTIIRGGLYMRGTLLWTDEQGSTHPLIGARIEVTTTDSEFTSIKYTDENGYYNIKCPSDTNSRLLSPTMKIYTANDNVDVETTDGNVYCVTVEPGYIISNYEYSRTFSPDADDDLGKAMMVFQGAYNFSEQAKTLNGGMAISFCSFKYPGYANSGSYYSNNWINVSSNAKVGSEYPEYYAAWDVIGHEYGHHIQHYFDLNSSPGGTHVVGTNTIDYKVNERDKETGELLYSEGQAKNCGLRLAWGEAWPTYWSTVAQTHFSEDLKSIATVGDTEYISANGVRTEIDLYYVPAYGDADEDSIIRILYKLYSEETDSYDKFSLGEETMWKIVKSSKKNSFSDFIEEMYSLGYDKNDLGLLLGKFNVITSTMSVENDLVDKQPTFKWSAYMGSKYFYFNSFDIYFINDNEEEITSKLGIETNEKTAQYTLTKLEWSTINLLSGTTYGVYIVARNDQYYKNGDYYSKIFTFNKPSSSLLLEVN